MKILKVTLACLFSNFSCSFILQYKDSVLLLTILNFVDKGLITSGKPM